MSRSFRGLISSALALAFLAALPAAQAAPVKKFPAPKHHHHVWARVVVRHPGDIYVNKATRSYLDPGPSADYGSDDLYFQDTVYPQYLLGPGIFQRQLAAPGEYN